MSTDWPIRTIDQVKATGPNAIAMGPFGSNIKAENFVPSGVPVIKGGNLTGDFLVEDSFDFLTPLKADELRPSNAKRLDLVITHRGTIGQVGIIPEDSNFERYVVSQSQLKVSLDATRVNPYFIYYFLRSPSGQHQLLRNASQVGVPAISRASSSVKEIEVPFPALGVQNAIADVLLSLDRRIRINQRVNQTLEQILQCVFTSWFVDFDPVRAKNAAATEGRDPLRAAMGSISGKSDIELERLSPNLFTQLSATATLFPSELVASEVGEVPKGWEVTELGRLCSRISMGPFGSDIKRDNFIEKGVPLIRGGNLTNGLVEEGYAYIPEEKANQLRNANAYPEDLVITHRGTLGQIGMIPRRSRYSRYVVSQSQMVLSVDREKTVPGFVFEFLRSPAGQHRLLANTSQVGVPAIARPTTSLKAIPLVAPDLALARRFDEFVQPLWQLVVENDKASRTLASLRETLLPRLFEGALSIDGTDGRA